MFIVLLLLSIFSPTIAQYPYISFDEGMKKNEFNDKVYVTTTRILNIDGNTLYNFFKELYEKNYITQSSTMQEKIPRTIHQIWVGGPVPEIFKELQQSWIDHHLGDGWTYKLWTDEDVAQMKLYNQEFYDAADNMGMKADLLRFEIIFNEGGFYCDMDFQCLRSLKNLLYYDFCTGIQPLDTFFVQLGSAFFGARAGHPILKHAIETVKNDWHLKGVASKTGPVHFTKSFYVMANKNNNRDIAFPAFYFYPFGSQDRSVNVPEWQRKGAYAVHWWAKSWMPKEYRPIFSRDIDNEQSASSWND